MQVYPLSLTSSKYLSIWHSGLGEEDPRAIESCPEEESPHVEEGAQDPPSLNDPQNVLFVGEERCSGDAHSVACEGHSARRLQRFRLGKETATNGIIRANVLEVATYFIIFE